jgi:hypothetical protein
LSRHHPNAQVALQQRLILQDDNLQVNQRWIENQGRSVICYESLKPFTQLNEHSLDKPYIYELFLEKSKILCKSLKLPVSPSNAWKELEEEL